MINGESFKQFLKRQEDERSKWKEHLRNAIDNEGYDKRDTAFIWKLYDFAFKFPTIRTGDIILWLGLNAYDLWRKLQWK